MLSAAPQRPASPPASSPTSPPIDLEWLAARQADSDESSEDGGAQLALRLEQQRSKKLMVEKIQLAHAAQAFRARAEAREAASKSALDALTKENDALLKDASAKTKELLREQASSTAMLRDIMDRENNALIAQNEELSQELSTKIDLEQQLRQAKQGRAEGV